MEALRIRAHVEKGSLHITGLDELAGQDVEVIILVESQDDPANGEPRKAGAARGQITLRDDFHEPLTEDEAAEFIR